MILDRAYGALIGGAIGDAMGMPASFMTRSQIEKTYGYIDDFLEPEKDVQNVHGNLQAAEITDDTMESVIICNVLLEYGEFTAEAFNKAMKDWAIEQKMLESTVIGPSTRRYLTALIEGRDPRETSGQGNTNGSAMRAAPIGVKYHYDMAKCVEAAAASSLPSHGSKPAVAAACAVAAAVAGGVNGGYSTAEILNAAYDAAVFGESKGTEITAPSVSRRIRLIERLVDDMGKADIRDILDELTGVFGASMFAYESVPLALGAFYAVNGNGKEGVLAAVNAGDDADTNGAICGNICGAYSGAASFPTEWKERVQKTSCLDMRAMAEKLIR
jgi:ADP-ribosylglycohydrolase